LAARARFAGFVLVLPALLVLLAVVVYPIGRSLILSMQRVEAEGGRFGTAWIWFDNYRRLTGDESMRIALKNSLIFTAVEVTATIAISLAVALLLAHRLGRLGIFRIILLVPWALAPVANAVLWKWILNGSYGVLNALLLEFGMIDRYVNWLGDPGLALRMMLLADIWKSVPFIALLLLAGLQNIPAYLYRAAKLDGASAWQRFRFVTWPGLRTPVAVAVVLQSIWSFKVFDLIFVLTKGGPGDGTLLLNFLAYRTTFNFLDFGYGAAIANVIFLIMLVLAIVSIRILKPGVPAGSRT